MRRPPHSRAFRRGRGYGEAEIAPVATVLFPEEHGARIDSAGCPTPHAESRVVDGEMRDVAPGKAGEIVHRSPQLLKAIGRAKHVRKMRLLEDGSKVAIWRSRKSRDMSTSVDRRKDKVKSGGENVASREVEGITYEHPAVSEVAVVGFPDEN